VLDDIPPILMPSGRRRRRPGTIAWLGRWRRLRVRYDQSPERFFAFVLLACSVICFKALQQPPW
jgi:transposase